MKNERTLFDVFGGGDLDKEYYSTGVNRSYGEMQFGESLAYKYTATTTFNERLVIFPNLTNTGNYRLNFDLSTDTKLRKWLAWQVAFSDRYISNPLPGTQRNNLIITTGVNLTFAK